MQLEFAGGYDWPETFKIKQLRRSISEKILDKLDAVKLPKDSYQQWVDIVEEVASNVEIRDNFIQQGETQVTQFTMRQSISQSNKTSATLMNSPIPQKHASIGVDYEGDTALGGMKIDLKLLTDVIAVLDTHKIVELVEKT